MASKSKIEWLDGGATWNPITGCTAVSSGCEKCYAARLGAGRLRNHWSRQGLTKPHKKVPTWTGEVRFNEQWLDQPARWKKPRRIFVCAHSDLFHEAVPDEWIDRIFAVMFNEDRHIFQCLTKRAERMHAYMTNPETPQRIEAVFREHLKEYVKDIPELTKTPVDQWTIAFDWPVKNVWMGVSVENQEATSRIDLLQQIRAVVRWVSLEPLLEKVDLSRWVFSRRQAIMRVMNSSAALNRDQADSYIGYPIDWLVVGGESGPGYRPMEEEWARSLMRECEYADTAFFMKQMAGKAPIPEDLMVREYPTVA